MPSPLAPHIFATVTGTAERLGAALPPAVADGHAQLAELRSRASTLDTGSPDDVARAIVDALAAGVDPAEDPAVQVAVNRHAVAAAAAGVRSTITTRTEQLLCSHAADIVEAFTGPFDRAAVTLVESFGRLGDLDLGDTDAVTRLGGDAAGVWLAAKAAEQAIVDIREVWQELAVIARSVPFAPHLAAHVIADVPASAAIEDPAVLRLRPWELVRRGWTLSLATPEEYRCRGDAIVEGKEARAAHAADGFGRAYKQIHGTGVSAVG